MPETTRRIRDENHRLHRDIPLRAYPYADRPQECPLWCCDECHFMFSPTPCMMCGLIEEDTGK